ILNKSDSKIISCEDFRLYPYQLPVIGIKGNDYLADFFSLIGLHRANTLFMDKPEPITIVMGKHRFDYSLEYIKSEIKREFAGHESSILSFIDEMIELDNKTPPLWVNEAGFPPELFSDWYKILIRFPRELRKLVWSDIGYLYKKYKLPPVLCSMFDALLFALSGVMSREFPLIPAVRILVSAMKGVHIPDSSVYTLRNELLNILPDSVEKRNKTGILNITKKSGLYNVRLGSYEGWVSSEHVISDKNRLAHGAGTQEYMKFPFTLYTWVDKDYIPESMSKWLMFIDVDKAGWFNLNDIYMVRHTNEKVGSVISITSFIPYKHLHSPLVLYKEKTIRMFLILESLIPYLQKGCARLYPDPYSPNFDIELPHSLENLADASPVYDMRREKRKFSSKENGVYYCGREIIPQLGFEGITISGLKIADKIIRRI
ncbi:MAG: hypothetical protein JXA66_03885, partial [Oligoflexia bacterium]|nr:hypothetical protein [Oligoflexia bacterium]